MQTDFDCYETLGIAWSNRPHEIVLVDPGKVRDLYSHSTLSTSLRQRTKLTKIQQQFEDLLESLGMGSAKAQGLRSPITTAMHLRTSECRVYLYVERRRALGLLKAPCNLKSASGELRLYQIQPLCVRKKTVKHECDSQVLDFYVHESCQRCGIGLALFQAMLDRERIHPARIAYDRPSPKLLSFLSKHYHLDKYSPQANKFVIFFEYFTREHEGTSEERIGKCIDAFSKPSQSGVPRTDAPICQSTHCETLRSKSTAVTLQEEDGNENEEEMNTQDTDSSTAQAGARISGNIGASLQVTSHVPSLVTTALSGFDIQHQREMIALQRSLTESKKQLESLKAEAHQKSHRVAAYTLRRPF